jgi:hypothetical protein
MIARLQRLVRIRKRQRQVVAARQQQVQQRAAAVEAKLDGLRSAARERAATGARAGELEAWAAGAVAVGRELERVQAVVMQCANDVRGRAFAEQRAQRLFERVCGQRQREIDRREQQETDDRFTARRTS